jgi:superoxide dismutase, Fe-Mn family
MVNEGTSVCANRMNKDAVETDKMARNKTRNGETVDNLDGEVCIVFDKANLGDYNQIKFTEDPMTFELPKLPYDYTALEPYMDARTVEIHHDKHHATYTAKLNAALEKYPQFGSRKIEEILGDLSALPEEIRTSVRNHGGGYLHHNLWWEQLKVNPNQKPMGKSADAILSSFGDFESFKSKMSGAAMNQFGSGWAWLSKKIDGSLIVHSTPNQDSPISDGLTPLLTIDVWEHAYYLKFQNKRDEFVANFWNLVNWEMVEKRFIAG